MMNSIEINPNLTRYWCILNINMLSFDFKIYIYTSQEFHLDKKLIKNVLKSKSI